MALLNFGWHVSFGDLPKIPEKVVCTTPTGSSLLLFQKLHQSALLDGNRKADEPDGFWLGHLGECYGKTPKMVAQVGISTVASRHAYKKIAHWRDKPRLRDYHTSFLVDGENRSELKLYLF